MNAVPSILTGHLYFPNFQDINYLKFLTDVNYKTSFFFGDKKTTFYWNTKMKNMGIQNHYGREDYEKETGLTNNRDKEGNIFEAPFLEFASQKIKMQKTPFFSLILTNHPHSPYYCSDDKKLHSLSVRERKLYCLNYIDQSLKSFFETLQELPLFENTLFIITGDHTGGMNLSKSNHKSYYYDFNVPLIVYHPKKNLKRFENEEVSSHSDIMPSLIDYLGLQKEYSMLHNSLFKHKKRFILTSHNKEDDQSKISLIDKNYIAEYFCENNEFRLFKNNKEKGKGVLIEDSILNRKYENILKSAIQYSSF